mmetsp:Transcript_13322/g.26879  ORF Transcript_13322/g.26879 Transcript_13322/m.26879 type:complete len:366 (+) Transcript_13322:142-1239(+)
MLPSSKEAGASQDCPSGERPQLLEHLVVHPMEEHPDGHQHRTGWEKVDLVVAQVDRPRQLALTPALLQAQEAADVFIRVLSGVDVHSVLGRNHVLYDLEELRMPLWCHDLPQGEPIEPMAHQLDGVDSPHVEHHIGGVHLVDERGALLLELPGRVAEEWLQDVGHDDPPRQDVRAAVDVPEEDEPRQEESDEVIHGLIGLLEGPPVHHEHLRPRAHGVDRPEELLDAVEGHRVHPAPGDVVRQDLQRRRLQGQEAVVRRRPGNRDGHIPIAAMLGLPPVLGDDGGPHVQEELLAVVGSLEAELVERPRDRSRAHLREARHHHLYPRLVRGEGRVLASVLQPVGALPPAADLRLECDGDVAEDFEQ